MPILILISNFTIEKCKRKVLQFLYFSYIQSILPWDFRQFRKPHFASENVFILTDVIQKCRQAK